MMKDPHPVKVLAKWLKDDPHTHAIFAMVKSSFQVIFAVWERSSTAQGERLTIQPNRCCMYSETTLLSSHQEQ